MKPSLAILSFFIISLTFSTGCGDLNQSAHVQDFAPQEFDTKEGVIKGDGAKNFDTKKHTFNRNPERIIFTKHGKCRMNCRSIDSLEVEEILKEGRINYAKSDTSSVKPCRKKYALEGTTRDNQLVRIIFSPCKNTQTVVTVIDMDTDWDCDCK